MLSKIRLELSGDDDKRHGYYMGPMMQAVFMDRIGHEVAEDLHENQRHPYSQCVFNRDGRLLWSVNLAGSDLRKKACDTLFDPEFQEVYLLHRDEKLRIVSRSESAVEESDLVKKYYFGECSRYISFRFNTPVSFKQDGGYAIFPSIRLIMQSLMLKHDSASDESTVFSEDILEDLENYCLITRYNLHSTHFPVGRIKIPSFAGSLTVKVNGPRQMANLVWFLAKYGEYTGIGIKTGMGMGAFEIADSEDSRRGGMSK